MTFKPVLQPQEVMTQPKPRGVVSCVQGSGHSTERALMGRPGLLSPRPPPSPGAPRHVVVAAELGSGPGREH